MRPALGGVFAASVVMLLPGDARAVDLPRVGDSPPSLEVTETSIVAQRFEARDGENYRDQGYFSWLNRLNALLSWKTLTAGLRLDSSFYELRPEDRSFPNAQLQRNAVIDGATRYRDAVYPAKGWLTYRSGIVEATLGDSYVTLGRGLVLSLRKVDELGIDTTLFGAKVTLQREPFLVTAFAGLANPTRVDEPSGRALFLSKPVDTSGPQPVFGNDRIIGGQLLLGRGLPVVSSTHVAYLEKCAPYRYNADLRSVETAFFDAPIGTCEDASVDAWLGSVPSTVSPIMQSRTTVNAGESIEVPNLWGHGNAYVEAAVQKHDPYAINRQTTEGNAVYGSLVTSGGPLTNTLEIKSYRNFHPLVGTVNTTRASAFASLAYSAPPTTETITEDSEFNYFNTCVTGGRDRLDARVSDAVLLWGALGYFVTRAERPGAQCDERGRSTADDPAGATNDVVDVSGGTELHFDRDRSVAFVSLKFRNDQTESNVAYYREYAVQYSITKYVAGPYSIELAGRHRHRQEEEYNTRTSPVGDPWWEGEHYNALKVAPRWIFSQGFEYTTFLGLPTYYVNGSVLYKFTSQSNVRVYVGQNRGGLRCTNGICRFVPAFSGARVELTLRF